jgi:very-short-patch-repair endonuclease
MTKHKINKDFVKNHLLNSSGSFNPRALEKYNISKEQAFQILNDMSGPQLCEECKMPSTFISINKGYTLFCSRRCVSKSEKVKQKKEQTLLSNYGTEGFKSKEIQDKKISTSLTNYGTKFPRQNADYVEKLKQDFLKKYGVTNPGMLPEAVKKREKTNVEKYGSKNVLSSNEIRKKIENTNLERYGTKTVLLLAQNMKKAIKKRQPSDIYEKLNDTNWLEINKSVSSTVLSEQLGIAWSTILNYYKKHDVSRPNIIVSKYEIQLAEFFKELGVDYVLNDRKILEGREIDIYLPSYKLGIEIDGLYWHSEKYISNKKYHCEKTEMANSKGIDIIRITDYEINNKFDIVKNRILAKIGKSQKIYARKCNIIEISNSIYEDFMHTYHIQGYAKSKYKVALEHEGKIVAIMSFAKSRYNKKYQYELIRYASVGIIIGGMSRLFSYFVNKYDPQSIISYSDIRWNNGTGYQKIGMVLTDTTKPNYWYIIDGIPAHRSKYQKHKLKNILKTYDETLTEYENMKNNGYSRYWDCGNKVFTWKKEENINAKK